MSRPPAGRRPIRAVELPSSEGVPIEESSIGPGGAPRMPLPSPRLLLVDPDARFGRLLRDYLETRGWTVDWVPDGREALRDWTRLAPDLLLTELQSDDLDGLELVDAVTRMASPPPVVICTREAGARAWDRRTRKALGVAAVVVRPVRFPSLAEVLEGVLASVPVPVTVQRPRR